MIGVLPESLSLDGKRYDIRHDYRDCLAIFEALSDVDLTDGEKQEVTVYMLYSDFHNAEELEEAVNNGFPYREALEQAYWFLNCGKKQEKHPVHRKLFDWEQDEQLIFSAVNKVADKEVREVDYMHFWTFMGYFQEVGESLFSQVVSIRSKKLRGEKLDKSEERFCIENSTLVKLEKKYSQADKDFLDKINEMIGVSERKTDMTEKSE